MKNRRLINQIAAVGGAACLALTILASPVATIPVQAATPNNGDVMPLWDIIQWRWKIENGGVYRRLYNYAVNEWIGEWEYVCPA